MKLVKCPNKHFYDSEKFTVCPHCAGGLAAPAPGPVQRPYSQQDGLGGSTGGRSREVFDDTPDVKTGSVWEAPPPAAPQSGAVLCGQCGDEMPADSLFCPDCGAKVEVLAPPPMEEAFLEPGAPAEDLPPPPVAPPPVTASPLQAAVAAARPRPAPLEDSKTVALYDFGGSEEPVVGWLVSVSGAYFGQSFNLKAGRNNIGRQGGNDVVLAQEGTVSRIKHAVLTFDPEQVKFFLQPGEGSGMTYKNKQAVLQAEPLESRDRLKFGRAEFVFVPLAGQGFSWEDFAS